MFERREAAATRVAKVGPPAQAPGFQGMAPPHSQRRRVSHQSQNEEWHSSHALTPELSWLVTTGHPARVTRQRRTDPKLHVPGWPAAMKEGEKRNPFFEESMFECPRCFYPG